MPGDDQMKKPKVIIVDDDRDTREMLTLALELEEFDVGQAANGLRLISAMLALVALAPLACPG